LARTPSILDAPPGAEPEQLGFHPLGQFAQIGGHRIVGRGGEDAEHDRAAAGRLRWKSRPAAPRDPLGIFATTAYNPGVANLRATVERWSRVFGSAPGGGIQDARGSGSTGHSDGRRSSTPPAASSRASG